MDLLIKPTNYLLNIKAGFLIRENGWYCELICPKSGQVLVSPFQYLTRYQMGSASWGKFEYRDEEGNLRTDWNYDCDSAIKGWFDIPNSILTPSQVWAYALNIARIESAMKKGIRIEFSDYSEKNYQYEKPFNGSTSGMGGKIVIDENGSVKKYYDNGRIVPFENIFVIDNLTIAEQTSAICDCIKSQWLKRLKYE